MGLSGLDIFKQLPKTNCKDCGMPTCLAFAMALASGKATLEKCPHVSEEAKAALGAASAPPIRLVTIGTGERQVELGDETVIFRHDKTFYHPTGVAIQVLDTIAAEELTATAKHIEEMVLERVGQQYRPDMIAVQNASGDAAAFGAAVTAVREGSAAMPLVLVTSDVDAAKAGVAAAGAATKPLLCGANKDNFDGMTALAKEQGLPLVIQGEGLDATANLATKAAGMGLNDLVLDSGNRATSKALADLTQMRRLAITKRFRPLGYPTIAFTTHDNPRDAALQAGLYVGKYASMIVTPVHEPHHLMPVLSWRDNVFTDPQKPIQVEAKVYSVGHVSDDSPVYVTTNFSLTYFTVEGEISASKIPGYILPVHTEGTSVLTAWAAGKFSAESITEFLKESGIEDMVKHRNLVLPGYVAVLSGKLQELSGWKVIVGPREASGLPAFAKNRFGSTAAN